MRATGWEFKNRGLVFGLIFGVSFFCYSFMAVGFGALMSRSGFALALSLMLVFNYRLILREESELRTSQGAKFESYCKVVPRLLFWPSPRIASSGRAGDWSAGFKAESWCWGFAIGAAAFAATLKLPFFFGPVVAGIALFWLTSHLLQRRAASRL